MTLTFIYLSNWLVHHMIAMLQRPCFCVSYNDETCNQYVGDRDIPEYCIQVD